MSGGVRIARARWADEGDRKALVAVRETVFVVEQKVPVEIEIDGADPGCEHLLAFGPGGEAIGTARMQPDGHIGRIAVLAEFRGRGVGARLVETLVEQARAAGLPAVDLNAQTHAVPFYEKLGFAVRGEVFMEAGIPHQNMRRALIQPQALI